MAWLAAWQCKSPMLVEELENFARQGVEAELIMVQCLYPVPLVTSSLSWRGKENQTKLLMSCNWPKSIDINKGVQESLRLFWSWFNLCPLVIHHYVHWAMARLDWLQCLYPVHHSRWLVHNHEEGKIKQNLIDVMQLTKVNWHWYRCSGELENSPESPVLTCKQECLVLLSTWIYIALLMTPTPTMTAAVAKGTLNCHSNPMEHFMLT